MVGFDRRQFSTFHPEGVKHWVGTTGAELHDGNLMHSCSSCGLTWAHVRVDAVHNILEKLGVARGEAPVRASYALHLLKWVSFLLVCGAATIWLYQASR